MNKYDAYWPHNIAALLLILKILGFGFSWFWLLAPFALKWLENRLPLWLERGKNRPADRAEKISRPLTVHATRS